MSTFLVSSVKATDACSILLYIPEMTFALLQSCEIAYFDLTVQIFLCLTQSESSV